MIEKELNLNEQEIKDFTADLSMAGIQSRIEAGTGLPSGIMARSGTPSTAKQPQSVPTVSLEAIPLAEVPPEATANDPETVPITPVLRKRQSRKLFTSAAAAVVSVLLLGSVAYALQGGYLETFFGADSHVPSAQLITPGDSVTNDGLIITLEEILPGERGGMVVVSYEWEDGHTFSKFPWIGEMSIGTEGSWQQSSAGDYQLQDDGKRLVWLFEIRSSEQITGEELIISGNTLYTQDYESHPLTFSLQDYFTETGYVFTQLEAQAAREALLPAIAAQSERSEDTLMETVTFESENGYPVEIDWIHPWLSGQDHSEATVWLSDIPGRHLQPDFSINGMILVEDTLYIAVTDESPEKANLFENNGASVQALLDTRTGETQYAQQFNGQAYVFTGIPAEDLPYLVPLVEYDVYEILTNASWHFTCRIEDNGQVKRIALDDTMPAVSSAGQTLQLTEAVVTPMEIVLYGNHLQEADNMGVPAHYRPKVQLAMKDGAVTAMELRSSRADDAWTYAFHYQLYNAGSEAAGQTAAAAPEEQQRRFLDDILMANLSHLLIDDVAIYLK